MRVDLSWVAKMLDTLLGGRAETLCRTRMAKAHDSIVEAMHARGIEPPDASVKLCCREALFRLWKSVVISGDVSDLLRDSMDRRVVERVQALFPTGAGTVGPIVEETRKALLAEVFGG